MTHEAPGAEYPSSTGQPLFDFDERQTLIFDEDPPPNPANVRAVLWAAEGRRIRWIEVPPGTTEKSLTEEYRKEYENIPTHVPSTEVDTKPLPAGENVIFVAPTAA